MNAVWLLTGKSHKKNEDWSNLDLQRGGRTACLLAFSVERTTESAEGLAAERRLSYGQVLDFTRRGKNCQGSAVVQQEKKQEAALRGESEHERTSNGRAQQSNAEEQKKEREELVHELTELRESERKEGESFCE